MYDSFNDHSQLCHFLTNKRTREPMASAFTDVIVNYKTNRNEKNEEREDSQ